MSRVELPKNWAQCELAELVDILDSQRVPVNNTERRARLAKATTTYPYYGATGQVGEIDDYIFEGESILLGEDGAPFLDPQKPKAYVVQGRYWVNNHAHILRAVGGVKNQFLCHQLNVLDYKPHVSGTTRLKLTQGSLRALPIKLAPLNKQRRIVEKIETLFAQIDKGEEALREAQKLLKRYRQSILKAAVTGELTRDWREANQHKLEPASDFLARILETRRENWQGRGKYKEPVQPSINELPELPQGWTWATVDQVTSLFRNGLSKKPVSEPNALPILRISAVRPMSVSLEDLRYYPPSEQADVDPFWVERGDLLFTRYSGSAKFVGVCGQLRGDIKVLHPDKLIKARPVSGAGLNRDYLELAWNTGWTRKHIAANIKTTSGQQGIAGADIKMAPFALPPLEEQKVIAERTWEAMERIASLEFACQSELVRSTNLRQSILKSAFTGQLVPQDPNDEPANELLARIRAEREAAPKKPSKKKATRKKARAKA